MTSILVVSLYFDEFWKFFAEFQWEYFLKVSCLEPADEMTSWVMEVLVHSAQVHEFKTAKSWGSLHQWTWNRGSGSSNSNFDPCLRKISSHWKSVIHVKVLGLKLLNCCEYLFISGPANKVQVHPISFSTHLSCLLKDLFRLESSVIHDSKVSVLEPADEMTIWVMEALVHSAQVHEFKTAKSWESLHQ